MIKVLIVLMTPTREKKKESIYPWKHRPKNKTCSIYYKGLRQKGVHTIKKSQRVTPEMYSSFQEPQRWTLFWVDCTGVLVVKCVIYMLLFFMSCGVSKHENYISHHFFSFRTRMLRQDWLRVLHIAQATLFCVEARKLVLSNH